MRTLLLAVVIFTSFLVSGVGRDARAIRRSSTYSEALVKGADAVIQLRVADEYGNPVSGSLVEAFFDMITFENHSSGMTDSEGVFTMKNKTRGNSVVISVQKEGYYNSLRKLCFSSMTQPHEVLNGRWQPDPMVVPMTLKKRHAPIRSLTHHDVYYIPATNVWCAFDLVANDWVAPNGKGKEPDVEFRFVWTGEDPMKWKRQEFGIRFPGNPCNGGCLIPAQTESRFPYSYHADSGQCSVREFSDSSSRGLRKLGMLDGSKDFVFRIRCVTNDVGRIVSCHYGRFRQLDYGLERTGQGSLWMLYDYNGTPGETNLEFEVHTNMSN